MMSRGRVGRSPQVWLREVAPSDLPVFFEQQRDREACHAVAFVNRDPEDRQAFERHWARILEQPSTWIRTVMCDGRVAGNVLSYVEAGQRQVGYWLGREFWGRGVATRALMLFIRDVDTGPLEARVARDNLASVRVLEKCGFRVYGSCMSFAEMRGEEIEELLMELEPGPAEPRQDP